MTRHAGFCFLLTLSLTTTHLIGQEDNRVTTADPTGVNYKLARLLRSGVISGS